MIKRFAVLAIGALSFFVPGPGAAADLQPTVLTPAQEIADVALMRSAYERVHPGLERYQTKATIDAAFDRLAAFAGAPHTDLEFYGAISEAIAAIHCDHSKAEYPASIDTYRRTVDTYLPLRFRLFGGRMYVASSDPTQAPIARGTEILTINGANTEDVLREIAPRVSYDGFTSVIVPTKLEADADLMGSDFEQFYPVTHGFPTAFALSLREPGAASAHDVTLHPISYKSWIALAWPAVPYNSDLINGTSWQMRGKNTAYLRVDSFVNYRRPVDAMSYFAAFFKAINESGATRLIVDLRWNGGGSTDGPISLARFLLDKRFTFNAPIRLKTLDYGDLPTYAQTWGDQDALFHPNPRGYRKLPDGTYEIIPGALHTDQDGEMLPIDVSPDRFKGEVIVLTGPRNASGSTMLIAKLHDAHRVRLVGESTGGSAEGPTAGFILFLKLPNSGITVRVPDMWNRMAISRFRHGYGVDPDTTVTPTLDDFLADRDPVLAAALAP